MTEKIEAFWQDATADDVAGIIKTGKPIPARFRDSKKHEWNDGILCGWKRIGENKYFIDTYSRQWLKCQVYREPSWWLERPDPGPGWRLLGKMPDEKLKPGDEGWDMRNDKQWAESCNANLGTPQSDGIWYRRRIEPVFPKFAVGQTVQVVGPKERPALHWGKEMDRYIGLAGVIRNNLLYEDGERFYNLEGIGIWCFREDYLEAVEPEPKHCVLPVGYTATLPNGQTITITAKGFEVTQ